MNVCVFFGGRSNEHEVSLRSSYAVLEAIDTEKHTVHKIGISRDGKWYLFEGENREILEDKWVKNSKNTPVCVDFSAKKLICGEKTVDADIIFPVMHGEDGEDGKIQAVASLLGSRLVGVSSAAASLCMDKYLCKLVARDNSIKTAPYEILRQGEAQKARGVFERLKTKEAFVKPTICGSSVGISRVKRGESIDVALSHAFKYSDSVLIEKTIKGRECEVAVLEEKGKIIASRVGALSYESDFYDYATKYKSNRVKYEIPAKIPSECVNLCRNYAKIMFKALGCTGLCRVDFFVTSAHTVYFNEVNAIPGFTEGSMYPMLMADIGLDMRTLVETLIKNAQGR